MSHEPRKTNVLVVDDSLSQLKLLAQLLRGMGYTPRPFTSGKVALEAARNDPPDLVLLDINMPEMSGYDVCRELKTDPEFVDLPVIFISSSVDTEDKIEAFDCGGVDFVTKPYRVEEVKARVQTHLKLSRLQRQLEDNNRSLEAKVAERTRQLAEANKHLARLDKAKSDFLKMISHELRTPLNGVLGISNIVFKKCSHEPTVEKFASSFHLAKRNLLEVVDDALLLTEIEVVGQQRTDEVMLVASIAQEANRLSASLADSRRIVLSPPPPSLAEIEGNKALLIRAFKSLTETAVVFSAEGESVRWNILAGSEVKVTIESRGPEIPDSILERIFGIFSVADVFTHGGDLGLRPAVAARIITMHQGTISAERLVPPGVRFSIGFPAPS